MDPNHTASEFQTTHWSLVYGARGDRAGLEHLLRLYWGPVYGFIRKQGYGGHDASDLTQDFLSQVVIGRDIVGRADPSRGRFRSFLKQALRNFLIDQHRTHRHSRGGPMRITRSAGDSEAGRLPDPRSAQSLDAPESGAAAEAEWSERQALDFDREWAATIVQITLQRVEDQARMEGLLPHWEAFRANILGPTLWRTQAVGLNELAARLGATDADQVSNMIQTMKRKFRRTLREVVGETVSSSDQIEQELADLRQYIGGA